MVRRPETNKARADPAGTARADFLAEGVGFEPTRELSPLAVFKTAAVGRLATLPRFLTTRCLGRTRLTRPLGIRRSAAALLYYRTHRPTVQPRAAREWPRLVQEK